MVLKQASIKIFRNTHSVSVCLGAISIAYVQQQIKMKGSVCTFMGCMYVGVFILIKIDFIIYVSMVHSKQVLEIE